MTQEEWLKDGAINYLLMYLFLFAHLLLIPSLSHMFLSMNSFLLMVYQGKVSLSASKGPMSHTFAGFYLKVWYPEDIFVVLSKKKPSHSLLSCFSLELKQEHCVLRPARGACMVTESKIIGDIREVSDRAAGRARWEHGESISRWRELSTFPSCQDHM